MSDLKVVELKRDAVDEDIVSMAEDLLRWAREGRITDMALGVRHVDGLVTTSAMSAGGADNSIRLIGLAEYVAHKVKMELWDAPTVDIPEDETDE